MRLSFRIRRIDNIPLDHSGFYIMLYQRSQSIISIYRNSVLILHLLQPYGRRTSFIDINLIACHSCRKPCQSGKNYFLAIIQSCDGNRIQGFQFTTFQMHKSPVQRFCRIYQPITRFFTRTSRILGRRSIFRNDHTCRRIFHTGD